MVIACVIPADQTIYICNILSNVSPLSGAFGGSVPYFTGLTCDTPIFFDLFIVTAIQSISFFPSSLYCRETMINTVGHNWFGFIIVNGLCCQRISEIAIFVRIL
jgi:hypothetical protein